MQTIQPEPSSPILFPSDEIGWSDESFELTVRVVQASTTLSEVIQMQRWLADNMEKGLFWAYGQQVAFGGLFKRDRLLLFRNFTPSSMENAYLYAKSTKGENNTHAWVWSCALALVAASFIALTLWSLIRRL